MFLVGCQPAKSEQTPDPSDVEQMQSIASEVIAEPEVIDKSYYVLVVGNDSRAGTSGISHPDYADGTGRSDTMILVRVDPVNYKIALITIPRDTGATLNGATTKINEVYRQSGLDGLMLEIESLTGVKPTYYFDQGFVQFEAFVDAFGGMEANVPVAFKMNSAVTGKKVSLNVGTQELFGAEALAFARMRSDYADNLDSCRQIQDRQIVESAIKKVVGDPPSAALQAQVLFDGSLTNFPAEHLAATVVDFAANANKVKIISGTGSYAGGIDPASQYWLVPRDPEAWRKVIQVVTDGGDPTTVVPLPEVIAAA